MRAPSPPSNSKPGGAEHAPLALVLDIDGTLIDSKHCGTTIVKRPHVDAFLDYCFGSCAGVAIWTNASDAWARAAVDVLRDADGNLRPWAFVWDGNRSRRTCQDWGAFSCDYDGYGGGYAPGMKPLEKVYKSTTRRKLGFTKERSIIVEDTPCALARRVAGTPRPPPSSRSAHLLLCPAPRENCGRNYGNAVYVPSYEWDGGMEGDDTLARLAEYLQLLAAQPDVRLVEKRRWRQFRPREVEQEQLILAR